MALTNAPPSVVAAASQFSGVSGAELRQRYLAGLEPRSGAASTGGTESLTTLGGKAALSGTATGAPGFPGTGTLESLPDGPAIARYKALAHVRNMLAQYSAAADKAAHVPPSKEATQAAAALPSRAGDLALLLG